MNRGKYSELVIVLVFLMVLLFSGYLLADDIPEGHVRLHYHRFDGEYLGWGLHIWGEGYNGSEVLWTKPVEISGFDDYGAYWDIPYKEGVGDLNFIIHKGDLKDPQPDRAYPDPDTNREAWAVSGDERTYTSLEEALKAAGNKIIRAVITGKNTIVVEFRSEISQAVFVRDGYDYIPLAKLDISASPVYTITTREELDISRTYRIECGSLTAYTTISPELIDEIYAYDGELGALYSKGSTVFKLWAPLASEVQLYLYKDGDDLEAYRIEGMEKNTQGVWSVEITGDLAGEFYQYYVRYGERGRLVLDPYARSMAAFDSDGPDKVGKGAVVDLDQCNPEGWELDDYVSIEDQEDVIIYEISVRDFTISEDSGVEEEKRGTYTGFIEKIPHLTDLGITHVQLMPVLNYYYGNERDRSFENRGSAGEVNYNWGYDPHNYFSPEGRYSLDAGDPHLRIKELKTLIKALHDAGIGVLLDVVYNHTAITSTLDDIVPDYYYRRNPDGSYSNGSGCGNDTASRRAMMRKLIIDSTCYWVKEYHIDGFRFDLMGLHDETTMLSVAEAIRALNPDAVLHGEGWNMATALPLEERYIKGENSTSHRSLLKYDNIAAVFSDTIRDGIIQPSAFSAPEEGGFVQGVRGNEIKIRTGVIGSMVSFPETVPLMTTPYDRFADDPEEVINYVSCHDDRTLWDKLNISAADASMEEKMRMHKLALAIVMTSQGKAFIHGGSEMLRSKPDPDNLQYGIDHNSYDSGDLTNQLVWSNKEKYPEIYNYCKGLIKLRREHEAFRMETMDEIQRGIEFIPVEEENIVAFRLKEQDGTEEWDEIVVIYNSNCTAKTIEIPGVDTDWLVVVDGKKAGVQPLDDTEVVLGKGMVMVPAISAAVIHN